VGDARRGSAIGRRSRQLTRRRDGARRLQPASAGSEPPLRT
jgi:hypothetical protein